ncbi:MAG TPA: NDP-sugar synthase [Syntrophomonadaceae bacterium]|nr:NDP-sugar synthase [Syntrophomonadaceae bacterium]
MKAMIMAAGVGSRLMPLTMQIPKPMVPMANRPLMENIVDVLQRHGFTNIIANLHYHADVISDYFGDGKGHGVEIAYSLEAELLGTAGGVKNCEWFLDDTFVIVSGDALTDIDLTKLILAHKKNGALATIALKPVEEVEEFGVVITDELGRINRFQEKPKAAQALSNLANTGIYIFEPEVFKYIPKGQFYDFGKQVFPHLVKIKAPFYGVTIDDYWCDVGNLETYRQAHDDILDGQVRVDLKGDLIKTPYGKALIDEGVSIDPGVRLEGNVVLGAQCRVEDGAVIKDSVIWAHTIINQNVVIEASVLGEGCSIGRYSSIKPGAVIAGGCILEENVDINPGQKVFSSSIDHKLNQG